MKPPQCFGGGGRGLGSNSHALCLLMAAGLLFGVAGSSRAGGVVTSCTEPSLRAAMLGGGKVTFACDGTITLANTISNGVNTVLDGTGHQVTISGGGAVRVFYVSTNVTLTAMNLTVANGRSTNGGGVFNAGGTIALTGAVFRTNAACWDGVSAPIGGGAIFNRSGTVCATNCLFAGNAVASESVVTNPPSFDGGAIWNENGILNLQSCVFVGNQVLGCNESTNPCAGGDASGGAIFNNGTNFIDLCAFSQNSAAGGNNGTGSLMISSNSGSGWGGAICNYGNLTASRSSFTNNSAYGGFGRGTLPGVKNGSLGAPGGAAGGGALCNFGALSLQGSTLAANTAVGGVGGRGADGQDGAPVGMFGGRGGSGGSACGALFNCGTANLVNDTVALNSAIGASGGDGGTGGNSLYWNGGGGIGGNGGMGGSGSGALADLSGLLQITNCTVASNSAVAGHGGIGGAPGLPFGAPPGWTGSNGIPIGGVSVLTCVLANTLLAGNTPLNFAGTNIDAGYNLSSDSSCAFTNLGMNNTDPKLGPLTNNGGPTLTMALLPGSPAIDVANVFPPGTHAPATDQRGFLRPQGPGVDLGAFEFQYVPMFTGISKHGLLHYQLQVCGLWSNETFTLQTSSNCLAWLDVTNCVACTNGIFGIIDPALAYPPVRFYRLKTSSP